MNDSPTSEPADNADPAWSDADEDAIALAAQQISAIPHTENIADWSLLQRTVQEFPHAPDHEPVLPEPEVAVWFAERAAGLQPGIAGRPWWDDTTDPDALSNQAYVPGPAQPPTPPAGVITGLGLPPAEPEPPPAPPPEPAARAEQPLPRPVAWSVPEPPRPAAAFDPASVPFPTEPAIPVTPAADAPGPSAPAAGESAPVAPPPPASSMFAGLQTPLTSPVSGVPSLLASLAAAPPSPGGLRGLGRRTPQPPAGEATPPPGLFAKPPPPKPAPDDKAATAIPPADAAPPTGPVPEVGADTAIPPLPPATARPARSLFGSRRAPPTAGAAARSAPPDAATDGASTPQRTIDRPPPGRTLRAGDAPPPLFPRPGAAPGIAAGIAPSIAPGISPGAGQARPALSPRAVPGFDGSPRARRRAPMLILLGATALVAVGAAAWWFNPFAAPSLAGVVSAPTVTVVAPADGRVSQIMVTTGARVQPDSELLVIDAPPPDERKRAELAARLDNAHQRADRLDKQITEMNGILDDLRTRPPDPTGTRQQSEIRLRLIDMKAQKDTATSEARELEQTLADLAARPHGAQPVKAGIDGEVWSIAATEGADTVRGAPLLALADCAHLSVIVQGRGDSGADWLPGTTVKLRVAGAGPLLGGTLRLGRGSMTRGETTDTAGQAAARAASLQVELFPGELAKLGSAACPVGKPVAIFRE